MKDICDFIKCTGCGACAAVCPMGCISFQEDVEGFLRPLIDDEKCCDCNKCRTSCPAQNEVTPVHYEKPDVYALQLRDRKGLKLSSSGGAFSALAIPFLESGGVVFGSKMDDKLEVYHTAIHRVDEIAHLQGSKYVQSDTKDTFKETVDLLEKGQHVMYVGCPCQIAGLLAVCGDKHYDNLITVDLVCHGVPPYSFFKKYINEIQTEKQKKILSVKFRSKEKFSRQYMMMMMFSDDSVEYRNAMSDEYMRLYLRQVNYRESCYICKFASLPRMGDFTIGDFVGVNERIVNRTRKKEGISVITINSEKAKKYFNLLRNVECWKRPLKEAAESNLCLIQPSKRPDARDDIFKEKEKTVKQLSNQFCKLTLKNKIGLLIGPENIRKIKSAFKG